MEELPLPGLEAPEIKKSPNIVEREYRVPPSFFDWLATGARGGERKEEGGFLSHSGVPFPSEVSCIYLPSEKRFIVRNSKAFHQNLRRLIAQWEKARFAGEPPNPAVVKALKDAGETARKESKAWMDEQLSRGRE